MEIVPSLRVISISRAQRSTDAKQTVYQPTAQPAASKATLSAPVLSALPWAGAQG
jgi:hypothetical protein